MKIDANSSTVSSLPNKDLNTYLSIQDERIHRLFLYKILPVVGFGASAICTVLSAAVSIQFMYGSIAFLALGVLGVQLASRQNQRPFIDHQPVGLPNRGNNCWSNSFFQIVLNNPHLSASLAHYSFLQRDFQNYEEKRASRNILFSDYNDRALRAHLNALEPQYISLDNTQQDVSEAFEKYFGQFGSCYHQFEQNFNGSSTHQGQPFILLSCRRSLPFHSNFSRFFSEMTDSGLLEKKFIHPPASLIIKIKRFSPAISPEGEYYAEKSNKRCQIPLAFDTDPSQIRGGVVARYECDGFILHVGNTGLSGHFIACVRRPGGWWICDDDFTRPLSIAEVEDLVQYSYFLSFTKI
ncbi:MAG: hypothetical protein EBZ47_07025 [Chlamydiae bacterium]|nr:hypothetical protein [Chlamydiota bacterium]